AAAPYHQPAILCDHRLEQRSVIHVFPNGAKLRLASSDWWSGGVEGCGCGFGIGNLSGYFGTPDLNRAVVLVVVWRDHCEFIAIFTAARTTCLGVVVGRVTDCRVQCFSSRIRSF